MDNTNYHSLRNELSRQLDFAWWRFDRYVFTQVDAYVARWGNTKNGHVHYAWLWFLNALCNLLCKLTRMVPVKCA